MAKDNLIRQYEWMYRICKCNGKSYVVYALNGGGGIGGWPLNVYRQDGTVIGVANNKIDYLNLWNSDATNQAVGVLTGFYGDYSFLLKTYTSVATAPSGFTFIPAQMPTFYADAMRGAEALGYDVRHELFKASAGVLPTSYLQSAKVILAPGISRNGKIAGIRSDGTIEEFTLTRNGIATFVDKNGILQIAQANQPRIDYSNGYGEYLVEASDTNFVTWSEDFTVGHWNQTRCIPNISAIKSNQGVLFNLVQKIDTTISACLSSATIQSAANTITYARITLRAGSSNKCDIGIGATFDPADGSGGSAWGNGSVVSVQGPGNAISSAGKIIITGLSTSQDTVLIIKRTYVSAGISTALYIYPDSASSTISGANVLATCAQIGSGQMGSYIKTTGSYTTRIADQLQSVNDIVPYNQATVFGNFRYSVLGSGNTAILLMKSTSWRIMSSQVVGSVSAYDGTGSSLITGGNNKYISKYDATNLKIVSAGLLGNAIVYNHSNIPGSNALFINYGGAGQAGMSFSCLAIFDRAFSDAESQLLTS